MDLGVFEVTWSGRGSKDPTRPYNGSLRARVVNSLARFPPVSTVCSAGQEGVQAPASLWTTLPSHCCERGPCESASRSHRVAYWRCHISWESIAEESGGREGVVPGLTDL